MSFSKGEDQMSKVTDVVVSAFSECFLFVLLFTVSLTRFILFLQACFNLGYAHFSLTHFADAVRYYEQDLGLARDRKDRLALARAYCNLGLAHKALGRLSEALDCQQKCLRLMEALRNVNGKFRALGNIGDLMVKVGMLSL